MTGAPGRIRWLNICTLNGSLRPWPAPAGPPLAGAVGALVAGGAGLPGGPAPGFPLPPTIRSPSGPENPLRIRRGPACPAGWPAARDVSPLPAVLPPPGRAPRGDASSRKYSFLVSE